MTVPADSLLLSHGRHEAEVSLRGARLRSFTVDGRALVLSPGTRTDLFEGAVLAPWPNRTSDGRYAFAGVEHVLPINEPGRGHALHGLVHDAVWQLGSATAQEVVMHHDLAPSEGYPFHLAMTVTYRLGESGLHWQLDAVNVGDAPAPYGMGLHPYLVAGPGPVDEWTLHAPFATHLEVDERLIPNATVSVEGGPLDFREPRTIGATQIDHPFRVEGHEGHRGHEVVVTAPGGSRVRVQWSPEVRWIEMYTADAIGRRGLAVEPMSCPPNALASGVDLIVLAPGQSHSAWALISD